MIIGFSGRIRNGKTELAHICERFGYERMYFAMPLKELIAELFETTVDEVNNMKRSDFEVKFDEQKQQLISKRTEIPIEIISDKLNNKIFHNTREIMQFLGTDIIRNYNCDWHVNKLLERIDPKKNYVFDDVRFENEKYMIEANNGIMFFVVRPYLSDISNHESETTLRWQSFDNIIINDNNLERLKFKWETFMENGFVTSMLNRVQTINKINTDENFKEKFLSSNEDLSLFDMMFINKCEFTYDAKFFTKEKIFDRLEPFNNCIFRVYYADGSVEIVTNPLMIEDLKFFM